MFKGNIHIISILMVFMILNSMPIDIYLPAVDSIAIDLNSNTGTVQNGIFIYMISMGVGQLLLGPASDKYGRKPIAVLSLIVYFIASVLATFISSIEGLMFSRLLQGIGACGCAITAMAVVRDIFNENESARVYSILNSVQSLVPALAPIAGGVIANTYGWRYCFVLLTVMSLITFFIAGNYLKETNGNRDPVIKDASYFSIVTNSQFIGYCLAGMAAMAFIVQYVVISPLLLMDNLGMTSTEFSLIFGANALIIIFASYLATKLIKSTSPTVAVIIGLILLLVSSVLFFIQPNPESITEYLVIVTIGSFGFSFCLGSAIGMSLSPFGQNAGKASSILGFFQFTITSLVGIGLGHFITNGAQSLAITVTLFSVTGFLVISMKICVNKLNFNN
ncbi:multidrug effflux MFS transporter [Xenorhabdus bovienii]|uniref:multidrug effflux MFS transporter n=1 Tax=Xenorhabdus bovienii TaxID=40576 RepID=UPI00237CB2AC|nr:multidrug effflux MFS transporter [Xenorhabdus bovienii]MDE1473792.1 multidrug effflux MFS transporter [Xenorhabdus bovienii]MDE9427890.1 multidrug effflux MFS transporter [Xenorhabdus bovienii]MDE9431517.1 multidrug effflux MFS transporter [Xenorhabdus bovienii]MDE9457964.1 multidrug effflux MFS transporter [Xenorhabdus bovienii]MDE9460010.1 multidrug effflux MFS transporter [Xenorhabdus bovienii]